MPRRFLLLLGVVAVIATLALPLTAYGLVNNYGMSFSGELTPVTGCLACHDGTYGQTVHGRFAQPGLFPAPPAGWTDFHAAGTPPVVGAPNPGSGLPWYSSGGIYPIDMDWMTLGDFAGGAATEYAFFNGSPTDSKANPWNLVEGLVAEPKPDHPLPIDEGEYLVGDEDPERGLYDVVYGCMRCHMLGTTTNTPNTTSTAAVPNPTVSIPATFTTPAQWARAEDKTAADFNTDPAVSVPGMSIQCEACHGTGFKAGPTTTKHWNSGTQLSHRIPAGTAAPSGTLPGTTVATLGDSQVCGQCHGSYTNNAGTLGIYGYTPNLPLRDFVNINGVSGGASYTYTPTEAEFLAAPTKWFLFPNGSNARGNHYYYNEWSTSGHSYRGALTSASPDALRFQAEGNGHYNAKTSDITCSYCHTGEGYLWSKDAAIMGDFTPTNANTGYMGQECVACHSPHPSGVGVEGNIREPDPAGVRSNAGLATANASMCEDCHNWQYEVQGTTPVYRPQASLASRGGPSHPQRETLHGKVMLEIPVAGEFMPGAECQECHMPKTNRSANRYSHGMHIMLPGKAKVWNAAGSALYANGYKGQDSCSPCHPGETQDELQVNIDKWQDEVAGQLVKTASAITAAQTGGFAEYSLTDSTKPGYMLVGRATWNYKSVGSDGSGGVHNPEYVIDGLVVAEQMAKSVGGSFDFLAASPAITSGDMGYIVGKVVNGDGSGAAGAKLTLSPGMATTVADAQGNFAFFVEPTVTTAYTVSWARSSVAATILTSGPVILTVGMANQAPVAVADSYSTPRDTALVVAAPGVLGNDTDANGDTLAAIKVSDPSHGTVLLSANGSFTYAPSAGYVGADSFTYKANDGEADSNTVTVSITVTASGAFTIEDQAAGVVFDRFVTGFSASYSAGTYVYGVWTGTRLEASFTGSKVTWIGPKQPNYGMADVYIDGVFKATVDCYAATGSLSETLFESTGLADGAHTISINLVGAKNAASTNYVVVIDKFVVEGAAPSGGGTRLNESAGTFTGTWIAASNPTYTSSTYRYSAWAGTTFTASFTGTKVTWIGPMSTSYGKANVYIDGGFVGTVDCYSAATGWRKAIWRSAALPAGTHTIQIKPTRTKNVASTNYVVVVDGLDVTP